MSGSTPGPRYVVIGAGAIGALLAAQFQLAGIDTVLVARGRVIAARYAPSDCDLDLSADDRRSG